MRATVRQESATQRLVEQDIDLERLHEGLEEYGGFCDCAVVMNVYVNEVFTPVRPRGWSP